jgi:hypothetical protein
VLGREAFPRPAPRVRRAFGVVATRLRLIELVLITL